MSRTIFAIALGLSLALAVGCGSKSESTLPNVKLEADSPPPGDPNAPKVDAPAVATWEMDRSKHVIPATPVKGRIAGVDVVPEALIESDELTFRVLKTGTPIVERSVKLKLAPRLVAGQPIPSVLGREWKVPFDALPGTEVPEVWREVGKDAYFAQSAYALTLELGPRKDGKVAGKIYLCLPDEHKTVLAGTFVANYVRSHTELPGPDDVPYIASAVTVTGAKPDAKIRVGFVAFTPMGVEFKELDGPIDPQPLEFAQWTRDDTGKTRLVAGDGKSRPFRFESVKLVPGRYLLSAAVAGGPAMWKWVEVPAGGALTENFALDASKTGGVEVSTPQEVRGKVYLAPADAPDRPALDADLFVAVASQVVRQDAEIVAGKATMKNLAPGKYEVRAGDLRGFVDVVAGKTAELTLKK